MKSFLLKILFVLIGVFIALQFFRIDKSVPETDPAKDFMNTHTPPAEIASILKSSCYDCHSYKTQYPWYSNIAPVSWWLQDHIDHGRDELNFSLWADYSARRADHKLEEAVELVEEEEMPLPSYTWGHPEARLTDQQREELTNWFGELRAEYREVPEEEESDE